MVRKLVFGLVVGGLVVAGQLSETFGQRHDQKPIELSGYSPSQAFEIKDGLPIEFDNPHLRRLLYRIQKTSTKNLEQYRQYTQGISWPQLQAEFSDHRLKVFEFGGRVKSVNRVPFPEAQSDDQIKGCYWVKCETETGDRFNVVALNVPLAWDDGTDLDERVKFQGFLFANLVDDEDSMTTSVTTFVSKRLHWYPDHEANQLGIGQTEMLLAENNVDLGLLDIVKRQNLKPLGKEDAEAFYQVLGAIDQIDLNQTDVSIGFAEVISNPNSHFWQPVNITGRVKQCVPVKISDGRARERLGTDHYYQLMVFPNLDGQKIVVKNPQGEDLVYRRFPVTVCARELPDGLDSSSIENQQVTVQGILFRFWSYRSDRTDESGLSGQISPLVLSKFPVVNNSTPAALNRILVSFILFLSLMVAALLFYLRWIRRSELPGPALPEKMDTTGLE